MAEHHDVGALGQLGVRGHCLAAELRGERLGLAGGHVGDDAGSPIPRASAEAMLPAPIRPSFIAARLYRRVTRSRQPRRRLATARGAAPVQSRLRTTPRPGTRAPAGVGPQRRLAAHREPVPGMALMRPRDACPIELPGAHAQHIDQHAVMHEVLQVALPAGHAPD